MFKPETIEDRLLLAVIKTIGYIAAIVVGGLCWFRLLVPLLWGQHTDLGMLSAGLVATLGVIATILLLVFAVGDVERTIDGPKNVINKE